MPARGAHWAARETASKRRFISLAGVGVCQEGGDWSPVACLPVGQALVWQEKFAKSLQTTFALSSLAIHFTASPWRGGLLLGAWWRCCCQTIRLLWSKSWSDSMIRETREARRATPAQINLSSRALLLLVCSPRIGYSKIIRAAPPGWNGAATSWCASLRLGHRRAKLHTRCHSCCGERARGDGSPQLLHWQRAVSADAEYKTTDCSSGSERKQRLCRMRLWGSALPINYHQ